MEITREKARPAFMPITINLTTESEARALWHILNVPIGCTLGDYMAQTNVPVPQIRTTQIELFNGIEEQIGHRSRWDSNGE